MLKIVILNQDKKKRIKSFELIIKNIPRTESKIIIGYSNLDKFLSIINCCEIIITRILEIINSNLK